MSARQGLNLLLSGAVAVTATLLFQQVAQAVSISDPSGDFLPTYTGLKGGDLDVLGAEVTLKGDRLFFSADLAAPIGTTPGALFVFGLDRGKGTQRFVAGTPSTGAGVFFDSVVILRPDGTGAFNDLISAANSKALSPADIKVSGSRISGNFGLSLFPSTGFAPNDYTWNFWPRVSTVAGTAGISDFAPNASNASVKSVSESSGLVAVVGVGLLLLAGKTKGSKRVVSGC
jgi:hypothetical protein